MVAAPESGSHRPGNASRARWRADCPTTIGCCCCGPRRLRRLDRVDAVLIDPRALAGEDLRVSRIRGAPGTRACRGLEVGPGAAGIRALTHRVGTQSRGAWATNGNGRSSVQVLVRRAHHPLAAAVIGEARRCGAAVVSLDVDELDDLRSTFDDFAPADRRFARRLRWPMP